MHERSLVSVKVEPRSTSRLRSGLFILPLFYLRDYNLRALTCVAKNASVEINLKRGWEQCKSIISYILYLPNYLKTNLAKFAPIWEEKGQKAGFLFSPDKLEKHTSERKSRRNTKSEEERRRTEKMAAHIVFMLANLEIFGRKNKLLDGRGLFGGKVFKNPARGIYFPSNGLP